MFSFSEIVGHEQIKEHMQAAIRDKKPFHAYLFQGEEGVGKEALARTFAAGLQCQSESTDKPCKECVSCRQMESGNQPDVIWVTREKASLGVDEIREQLCNTMDIKPFSSPYKIYLVPEAGIRERQPVFGLLPAARKNDRGGTECAVKNN